ncbi:hypothetical protein PC119_g10012 [Phytophthora cactorum]|nr:hypothetical protein PC119_g10012 [Phytophthora cactorum]
MPHDTPCRQKAIYRGSRTSRKSCSYFVLADAHVLFQILLILFLNQATSGGGLFERKPLISSQLQPRQTFSLVSLPEVLAFDNFPRPTHLQYSTSVENV